MAREVTTEVIDADILKIVAFTVKKARTVKEISEGLEIPLLKAYELVHWMDSQGFLVSVGKGRTAIHGKAMRYISTVKSGRIELYHNHLVIVCEQKNGECRRYEEDLKP